MTLIVKTVTRWVIGFIMLFGIYTVLYGHHAPGGGFAGGVILAGSFILLMLAMGKEECLGRLHLRLALRLSSGGIALFLVIGLLGVPLGGYFLANFLFRSKIGVEISLLSAGTIQPIDVGIALLVTCAVYLIFALLSFHKVVTREGNRYLESSDHIDEE